MLHPCNLQKKHFAFIIKHTYKDNDPSQDSSSQDSAGPSSMLPCVLLLCGLKKKQCNTHATCKKSTLHWSLTTYEFDNPSWDSSSQDSTARLWSMLPFALLLCGLKKKQCNTHTTCKKNTLHSSLCIGAVCLFNLQGQ